MKNECSGSALSGYARDLAGHLRYQDVAIAIVQPVAMIEGVNDQQGSTDVFQVLDDGVAIICSARG
jgi:hypothetical protein